MRSIEQAASLVYEAPPMRAGAPFPYPDFFNFFLELIRTLTTCQPTPAQGHEYLTWRPWKVLDWFGHRLAKYRAGVETLMAVQWRGDADGFRAFADSVWDRVDGGAVTRELVKGCYADAKG